MGSPRSGVGGKQQPSIKEDTDSILPSSRCAACVISLYCVPHLNKEDISIWARCKLLSECVAGHKNQCNLIVILPFADWVGSCCLEQTLLCQQPPVPLWLRGLQWSSDQTFCVAHKTKKAMLLLASTKGRDITWAWHYIKWWSSSSICHSSSSSALSCVIPSPCRSPQHRPKQSPTPLHCHSGNNRLWGGTMASCLR